MPFLDKTTPTWSLASFSHVSNKSCIRREWNLSVVLTEINMSLSWVVTQFGLGAPWENLMVLATWVVTESGNGCFGLYSFRTYTNPLELLFSLFGCPPASPLFSLSTLETLRRDLSTRATGTPWRRLPPSPSLCCPNFGERGASESPLPLLRRVNTRFIITIQAKMNMTCTAFRKENLMPAG